MSVYIQTLHMKKILKEKCKIFRLVPIFYLLIFTICGLEDEFQVLFPEDVQIINITAVSFNIQS